MIPVGELRGEKKASFELPETRIICVALPVLQSTLHYKSVKSVNHLGGNYVIYLISETGCLLYSF